jgi:hypothetical protein
MIPYSLVFIRTKRRDDCGHGQQERPTRSRAGESFADVVSIDGDEVPGLLAVKIDDRDARTDRRRDRAAEPARHQHLDEDHGRASSKIATWMSVGYQPAIGLNSCGQAEIAMMQSIQAFSTT